MQIKVILSVCLFTLGLFNDALDWYDSATVNERIIIE
jgi:hypothetical protein